VREFVSAVSSENWLVGAFLATRGLNLKRFHGRKQISFLTVEINEYKKEYILV
jgi:hypothetical protein